MSQDVNRPLSILIAEDEPIIAAHLAQLLTQLGHAVVHVAIEAKDAIARTEVLAPDLVLMDISLPGGMDGIEAAFILQQRLQTPVIFITGATDEETIQRAVRVQPFGYLPKPFKDVEIRCAIEVAMERHRVETSLQRREHVLVEYAESLRSRAFIDGLTGLYNRSGFLELSRQHLKGATRHQRSLVLLFLDLNGLKLINDTLGHQAGDLLIRDMATVLLQTFRESDLIARLGGDEFVVLALETQASGGNGAIKRLRQHIDIHNLAVDSTRRLSVSIGCVVPDPLQEEPIESLLARADAQMYLEKRASRS